MAEAQKRNPKSAAQESRAQAPTPKAPQAAAVQTQTDAPAPFDYTEVFAFASANVDAFVGATEAWLRGLKAINEELVQFADTRMQAMNATAHSVAEADDASALADASLEHARAAAEEYFAETAKVVNLTTE